MANFTKQINVNIIMLDIKIRLAVKHCYTSNQSISAAFNCAVYKTSKTPLLVHFTLSPASKSVAWINK